MIDVNLFCFMNYEPDTALIRECKKLADTRHYRMFWYKTTYFILFYYNYMIIHCSNLMHILSSDYFEKDDKYVF